MLLTFTLLTTGVFAQYDCGVTDNVGRNFSPYDNYSSCDVDVSKLSEKKIRIIIHVFQKDDGTENIPNTTAGRQWISYMWKEASSRIRNLDPMTSPTSSPYIANSKIALQEVGVYFWKSTSMWAKGDNTSSNGNALYQYVMGKTLPNKNNAIHIFIPGNFTRTSPRDGLGVAGIASGIGDKKWSLLEDVYDNYSGDGKFWYQSANLAHEIGHNMGLFHTFRTSGDYCDDTPVIPPPPGSWNYDNNIASYNRSNNAMTADQITRCHISLQDDSYILSAGSQSIALSGTVTSGPNTKSLSYTNEVVGSENATVIIPSSSASSVTWTKVDGSASYYTSDKGRYLSLSGLTSITFTTEWTNNCIEFENAYVFYRGYNYSVGPNPASSYVQISEETPAETFKSNTANATSSAVRVEEGIGITDVKVYDYNRVLVASYKFTGVPSTQIDISQVPSGVVYIVVEGSAKAPVTLKVIKQ